MLDGADDERGSGVEGKDHVGNAMLAGNNGGLERRYKVNSDQIYAWKKQLQQQATRVRPWVGYDGKAERQHSRIRQSEGRSARKSTGAATALESRARSQQIRRAQQYSAVVSGSMHQFWEWQT